MDLAGKTAWLTGASSGIGEALAVAFAGRGTLLVPSARRGAELATKCWSAARSGWSCRWRGSLPGWSAASSGGRG